MAKVIPDRAIMIAAILGVANVVGLVLGAVHEHGRWSAIDDIYHKYNGFVVIPDETDTEGEWFKDQD